MNRPFLDPAAELVEMCWRFQSVVEPSRTIQCAIYQPKRRPLQARVEYDHGLIVDAWVVKTLRAGRTWAARWRTRLIKQGGFRELSEASQTSSTIQRRMD